MSRQAAYLDLKDKLRSQTNSYDELRSFIETNTDIDINTLQHNETLKKKDGSLILLSDLDNLTKIFIPIKLRRQLPTKSSRQQRTNKFKMRF
jgi:hypothetical protein